VDIPAESLALFQEFIPDFAFFPNWSHHNRDPKSETGGSLTGKRFMGIFHGESGVFCKHV
jgi:hypothetical protein